MITMSLEYIENKMNDYIDKVLKPVIDNGKTLIFSSYDKERTAAMINMAGVRCTEDIMPYKTSYLSTCYVKNQEDNEERKIAGLLIVMPSITNKTAYLYTMSDYQDLYEAAFKFLSASLMVKSRDYMRKYIHLWLNTLNPDDTTIIMPSFFFDKLQGINVRMIDFGVGLIMINHNRQELSERFKHDFAAGHVYMMTLNMPAIFANLGISPLIQELTDLPYVVIDITNTLDENIDLIYDIMTKLVDVKLDPELDALVSDWLKSNDWK